MSAFGQITPPPTDYLDTTDKGWEEQAMETLLFGENVTIYDPPTRKWVKLWARWIEPRRPALRQMRKILREDFGIVAGKEGRRR